jgi:hypothetical protein
VAQASRAGIGSRAPARRSRSDSASVHRGARLDTTRRDYVTLNELETAGGRDSGGGPVGYNGVQDGERVTGHALNYGQPAGYHQRPAAAPDRAT